MLKGYRTFALGLVPLVVGVLGLCDVHLAPETINANVDLILGGLGGGVIVLRFATDTPVFGRVASFLGLSPATVAAVHTELVALAPDGDFFSGLSALASTVNAATGKTTISPALVDALSKVAAAGGIAKATTPPVVPTKAAAAVMLLIGGGLLVPLGGCDTVDQYLTTAYDLATGHSQTLAESVFVLGEVYQGVVPTLQGAIDKGLITDKGTITTLTAAIVQAHDDLKAAGTAEKAGATNAAVLYNTARAEIQALENQATTLGLQIPTDTPAVPAVQPVTTAPAS